MQCPYIDIDFHTGFFEVGRQTSANLHIRIFQDTGSQQRDLAAQLLVDAGKFQSDYPAADNDHALRNMIHREQIIRCHNIGKVDPLGFRHRGIGSRGNDNGVKLFFGFAFFCRDAQFVFVYKSGFTGNMIQILILLKQVFHPANDLFYDVGFAFDDLVAVDGHVARHYAENFRFTRFFCNGCALP